MALVAISAPNGATGQVTAGALTVEQINGITLTLARSNLGHSPEHVTATIGFNDAVWPAGVRNGSYDSRVTHSDFEIHWDDAGSVHTLSERTHPAHRNANVSYGFLGSHVYRQAGTFTVTALARNRMTGQRYMVQEVITVADGDAFYPAVDILFVDVTGIFTNAPAGARTHSSLQDAFVWARTQSTPQCIMMENGQTHVDPFCRYDYIGAPSLEVRLRDRSGPKVKFEGSAYSAYVFLFGRTGIDKNIDIRISGIIGEGDYNPRRPDLGGTTLRFISVNGPEPEYIMVDDCQTSNYFEHFNVGAGNGSLKAFSRWKVRGWQNYGFFLSRDASIVDCSVRQAPDAHANGTGVKLQGYPDHGPLRWSYATWINIEASDFRSGNGWTSAAEVAGIQRCLRLNTNGTKNAVANVRRCHFEGGQGGFGWGPANATTPTVTGLCTVGECTVLADSGSVYVASIGHSGLVVENVIRIGADCSATGAQSKLRGFGQTKSLIFEGVSDADTFAGVVRFRNCIDIILRDITQNRNEVPGGFSVAPDYDFGAYNHRTYYAGMVDGGVDYTDTEAGPFDIVTHADQGILPGGYLGYFDDNDLDGDNEPIYRTGTQVPDTTPLWITPQPTSDMKGDGDEGGPEDIPGIDFLGNHRSPSATGYTPDRGPFLLTP